MGKVRRSGKRRSKAIGSRATAGLEQGMNDQTPQPEQVLPVIQKVSDLEKKISFFFRSVIDRTIWYIVQFKNNNYLGVRNIVIFT